MLPFMLLLVFFFYIFSLIGMSFFAGKIIYDVDGNDIPIIIADYEKQNITVKYHAQRDEQYQYPAGTPYYE